MAKTRTVKTLEQIETILSKISFTPSCVDMGWGWQAKEIEEGFLIRTSFRRPDIYKNGEIGTGFGRWMHFAKDSPTAGIIKTAWVCAKMVVEHELMEAFQYRGATLFNPHKSLTDLAYPKEFDPEDSSCIG